MHAGIEISEIKITITLRETGCVCEGSKGGSVLFPYFSFKILLFKYN